MSLAEVMEFPMVSCDVYFESEFWKKKLQAIESRDEMQMKILAELQGVSLKLSSLLKRPPVVIQK